MKIQIVSTKGYTTFYPNAVCFYKIGEIYEVKTCHGLEATQTFQDTRKLSV